MHDIVGRCYDFNPVCSRGYTASFIAYFESAVADLDGGFFVLF